MAYLAYPHFSRISSRPKLPDFLEWHDDIPAGTTRYHPVDAALVKTRRPAGQGNRLPRSTGLGADHSSFTSSFQPSGGAEFFQSGLGR